MFSDLPAEVLIRMRSFREVRDQGARCDTRDMIVVTKRYVYAVQRLVVRDDI